MPESFSRSEPIPSFSLAESRLASWENLLNAAQGLVQDENTRENDRGAVTAMLTDLEPLEFYWGFPGRVAIRELKRHLSQHAYPEFLRKVAVILRALKEQTYRYWLTTTTPHAHPHELRNCHPAEEIPGQRQGLKPYFEVLIVDASDPSEESGLREALRRMRHADDSLVYDCMEVPSVEDAVLAVLVNFNIQALLVRGNLELHTSNGEMSRAYIAGLDEKDLDPPSNVTDLSDYLSQVVTRLRPEIDLYLIEEASGDGAQGVSRASFDGTFHDQDSPVDLHLAILQGVEKRRKTPFFDSMKEYSQRSTDAFHASPLSRGASIRNSRWISGIEDFYGNGISVATTGGLVSLLSPSEPLRRAQELAAQTFGAERTFFVTNGTSTANKIVVQAMLRPGDVVLADHDCHKSHQYGFVLSGAQVCYLESYHLSQFSLYGAVPTAEILNHLLLYKHAGKLSLVRMLLLTNCTFDGIVYNVENVMQAALSIKPDLVFLWDEAWFAFAGFHPTYRRRTAMHVAAKLRRRYCTPAYREEYRQWCRTYPDETMRDIERRAGRGLPDPDLVRIRVYSTQSTHKTLSAFRQASMIHAHDQDFEQQVATPFYEARMAHTSTSQNYNILASLDFGRCQMALEGFELVQKQIARAISLRESVPAFNEHLRFLAIEELIPSEFRKSHIESYCNGGWSEMDKAWEKDELTLDPTHLTLFTGDTGISGVAFRSLLMKRYGIQVNKTSRNTVLLVTHIGTSRSAVNDLLSALADFRSHADVQNAHHAHTLNLDTPRLPRFSGFHAAFRRNDSNGAGIPDGDIRTAFFWGLDEGNCCYRNISDLDAEAIGAGVDEWVSALFVIPYPPGVPILVPGQIVTSEIVSYLREIDIQEIHGYEPDSGLRLFSKPALTLASHRA